MTRTLLTGTSLLCLAAAGLALETSSPASADSYKVLYSFCAKAHCADGNAPYGNALVRDASGTLYGATGYGGDADWGTVFALSPDAKKKSGYRYTRLYSFCSQTNCTDGYFPSSGPVRDVTGNLYGTTLYGGAHDKGVVYELERSGSTYSYKVLYSFCAAANCLDGASPSYGGLTYEGAASGAPYDGVSPLYGITPYGGKNISGGVAFQLTPGKHGWKEEVLYHFCAVGDCFDGYVPNNLLADRTGHFVRTTLSGGVQNDGVVFELARSNTGWKETVLHDMCSATDCTDGRRPSAPLLLGAGGDLIGTTSYGGAHDDGTIFKLTPNGRHSTYSVVHDFCAEAECGGAAYPYGAITMDASGNVFGTTSAGADDGATGVVYELSGATFTPLYRFCPQPLCKDGNIPLGGVILGPDNTKFGMTNLGGSHGQGGVVFELSP